MFFFHVYVSDYLGLALKTRFLFEIFCRPIWVCFFSIYYFRRQSIRNCPTSVSPPADAYVSNMPIYREIHLAKLKKGNLSIHFHIVLILNLSCTAYWQLRKFCFRRQLAKLRHVFLFHRQHKYYKTYLKLWNSFSTSFIWNNIFDGESYGVFGYCSFSFWKSFIIFCHWVLNWLPTHVGGKQETHIANLHLCPSLCVESVRLKISLYLNKVFCLMKYK